MHQKQELCSDARKGAEGAIDGTAAAVQDCWGLPVIQLQTSLQMGDLNSMAQI
jgi:hypothetical protein